MSGADAKERLLEAAISLGRAGGVGALTVQGIASAAGVSKALVLYHFGDKNALLAAIAARLLEHDVTRIGAAAAAEDPLDAWRQLALDAEGSSARALLSALLMEPALHPQAAPIRHRREEAAAALGSALLGKLGLRPRHSALLIGRVILHQLDGVAASQVAGADSGLDASLDAFALSLLALGD